MKNKTQKLKEFMNWVEYAKSQYEAGRLTAQEYKKVVENEIKLYQR